MLTSFFVVQHFTLFLRILVTLKQYIWISQTGTFLVYAFNTLSTRHQISLFSKQCSTVLRAVIQSQILRSTDPSMWKCMTHMNTAMKVWTSSMCQRLELDMSNNFVVNHLKLSFYLYDKKTIYFTLKGHGQDFG